MKIGDRVRCWGATPTDEVFTVETTGSFNITRLAAAIEAKAVPSELWELPVDKSLVDHVLLRDIDKALARTLSAPRLYQPGILLRCPPIPPADGEGGELIDGAHRVFRLHEVGATHAMFHAVMLADAEPFRVTYQILRDGKWEPLAERTLLEAAWGHYPKAPPG